VADDRISLMTPEAMLGFHALFTAKSMEEGKEPTFSATLLFSPEVQATPEFAAMKDAAAKVAKAKWPNGMPENLRNPFRKCEEKPNYYADLGPGWLYINCSTKQRPDVIRIEGSGWAPISDENHVYSGCFVKVTVSPYAYDQKGNRGVSFGLGNVLKVRDGERRGGRPSAADDFAGFIKANPAAASAPAENPFD
jgi:hypothetical protein